MQMNSSDSNDMEMREIAKSLNDHRGRDNWKNPMDNWPIADLLTLLHSAQAVI